MPQAAGPHRIPLIVAPSNRDGTFTKDAKLVNCYIETQRTPEGLEYWVYKRPGRLQQSYPPATPAAGNGVYNWNNDIYSIFGPTLYKNGVAIVGTLDQTNGVYRFSSNLGATPHLQLGNGVKGYNYDDGAGLAIIPDADFPAAFCKGWAYLDSTTYVLTPPAHIQGSNINDAASWDPLNDLIAQIEPDRGVALAKQLVYVVAFKEWSTEIFYDAQNATGSPLGAVQGAKLSFGCVSADSIQDIDGGLYWLCASKGAGIQIAKMESLKFEPISTKPLERVLQGADWSTTYSWQLSIDGHRFYVITSKVSNFTFAWDLDEGVWHQWSDSNGNYVPIVGAIGDGAQRAILQHESDGKLYYASSAYTNDAGETIVSDIITPNFDGGTQSLGKMVSRMFFVADRQVGSELYVRVNDADYDSTRWSSPRRVDLNQRLPHLDNCGTFNRRAHWLQHRSDTPMRLKAVELQVDLCTLPAASG